MSEHTTTACLLFPDIFDRPVVATFDQRQGSSDGGAILLKAAERRLGLTSALAAALRDDRQPGKVQHALREYLVAAVLRPGNVPGSAGAVGILRRLIRRVQEAFPAARIRVRLDGGFASPKVLDFLDGEPKVEYLVNLAANAVLQRKVQSAMKRARGASGISDQTEHVYGECRYATRQTWPWKRRVIYKAEVVRAEGKEPKDNPRFVVTNLKQRPQWIYQKVYCLRGDVENRIKLRPVKLLDMIVWQGGPTKPRIPLRVAYEVRAARQQTVRSPRTMYPQVRTWHQNREETVYLPA